MREKIITYSFRVASYESDSVGELRPSALLNHLQESATIHSYQDEVPIARLQERGVTWVVTRFDIHFLCAAKLGQDLTIKTWSSSKEELFITRDFEVTDDENKVVAIATISYALIDFHKRKLARIEAADLTADFIFERRVISNGLNAVPQLTRIDRSIDLPVMLRDLDMNNHVNNVIYAQWALEAVPLEVWKKFRPSKIEINFKLETRYEQIIRSSIQTEHNSEGLPIILHQIFNVSSGFEAARIRTHWNERSTS